ncbi:MAG TPA: DUF421 domain-containing protein [Bacillota bacterium]|nr:DUF421 domain-containing protein [Bacillota bacterium]HOL08520.1 DUF421 domain-containing protein [Bacillota bacterium]HPO96999.1 DUF421 domain-containing protein [Bacillota bacterium]
METWQQFGFFALNLTAIYIAALIVVRLIGKRALGELSLFDLVIMVGIGEVIVIVGLEQKEPLFKGILILILLGGLEVFFSMLTFKSKFFSKLIEGKPTILIKDGTMIEENLAREHISHADLRQELRKQGISRISKVAAAILEPCGKFSIIERETEEEDLYQQLFQEIDVLKQELRELKELLQNKEQ